MNATSPLQRIHAIAEQVPGADIARTSDPESSHDAARELTESGARVSQNDQARTFVERWPGCTADELADLTGWSRERLARRLSDLRNKGFVRQGEIRPCRVKRGRREVTWLPVAVEVQIQMFGGAA